MQPYTPPMTPPLQLSTDTLSHWRSNCLSIFIDRLQNWAVTPADSGRASSTALVGWSVLEQFTLQACSSTWHMHVHRVNELPVNACLCCTTLHAEAAVVVSSQNAIGALRVASLAEPSGPGHGWVHHPSTATVTPGYMRKQQARSLYQLALVFCSHHSLVRGRASLAGCLCDKHARIGDLEQ